LNILVTNQRELTGDAPAEMRDRYGGEPERVLAAQVRAFREKLGMTQEQVAREMSARGPVMRQSTIAKIEAGQRPVRVNEAVMLAAILHCDLAALLTDPGQRDRRDDLAAARDAERELLGLVLQAVQKLEEHRAAHVTAGHALREAEIRAEALQIRYTEAQARAEALAAEGGESG
jgi:transcriptional regulator with XRE-family HTH domain